LGAFSSAFFLYGVAFAYALSGSTRIEEIGRALSAQATGTPSTVALLAVGLLAVGFAFKVSAVPFHMWTPDAYEGAPTIVTAFMLSLGGIPPTAGFIGKWYIFSAAVQEGHYWLAIIGVLTSVVSVFFYLRIVVMMYMTEGSETLRPRVPGAAMVGLAFAVLAV